MKNEGKLASGIIRTSTSSCSFYSTNNTFGYSTTNRKFKPGITFSNFSDEVRLEGGHENCCRFATLTGVHQGAHACLAKVRFKGKNWS